MDTKPNHTPDPSNPQPPSQNAKINPVLAALIATLSFGQIYELERGLFLSEFDRKSLCAYLLDELDRRREADKRESTPPVSFAPKDGDND